MDLNVVMTGGGKFIEIQGTAEGALFDQETLSGMLDLARDWTVIERAGCLAWRPRFVGRNNW